MRLDDIRTLIIESDRERDWHELDAGPYFKDAPDVDAETFEWHSSLIVYRQDVNLTIQWGMRSRGFSHITKSADLWRSNAVFPDPSASAVHADVFWAGSVIDRVQLVYVDGGRGLLPVGDQRAVNWDPLAEPRAPKEVQWEYSATRWEMGIARLLDSGHHFDDFVRRIGMIVTG